MGFRLLLKQAQNDPVQATGSTRNDTNLHLEPGRETEHLFQLNSGSKVSVLKRATAEKNPSATPAKAGAGKEASNPRIVAPILEDWWLVRDPNGNVGWVLARMIDLDVPLEIAQYAEGQRLVAFFVLNQVTDGDKKVLAIPRINDRTQGWNAIRLQPSARLYLEREEASL